ncbi:unnamed protein product [Thelazia callipaeda]|uniref:Gamma interferon inducible lysosomal thiol reductase GILT n=1 Tax=Thelazia callipaeda TaxID=103827 RepID=A0A0N5DAJ5_THECL|nr:unnamed protein product [Thelazia callipaeda]
MRLEKNNGVFHQSTQQLSPLPAYSVVNLAVYIESQCSDTSSFIHRRLLPAWKELSVTNRISIKIVPFGKAKCYKFDSSYNCECQHGPSECELNQLMNCVIYVVRDPLTYVPMISCIQGRRDLNSAILKCLSKFHASTKG